MIYPELFLAFLQVGAFSFGGAYGMIPVIRDMCLSNNWLTEEEILNFIAVAESTPGPIAVNMATFVGSSQAGIFGSLVATLGVVLPSFSIILLIASVMANLIKYQGVQAGLNGTKPVVVGLIIATGATMLVSLLFGVKNLDSQFAFDGKALFIFLLIVAVNIVYKRIKNKQLSPILSILFSALLGILLYGAL